jgi:AcrR family transcriptional regulator
MSPTKARILDAAIALSRTDGVQWITRDAVAQRAGCAAGLVNYHWKSILDLKRAVFAAAVDRQLLPLIAQGLADGNRACLDAPEWLRKKAAEWSAEQ